MPYRLSAGEHRPRVRREAADVEIAPQPQALPHPWQGRVGQPARKMAGGIDILAPRPLHGDAKGVADVAARHLVVADDRRQDRQAGGIRGCPALGSQAIRVQIERGCLRGLPARVGETRLPELVKAAARRIDHDQVTIARTLALELGQRDPGPRQRARVFIARERPVFDRRIGGNRERSWIRFVRVLGDRAPGPSAAWPARSRSSCRGCSRVAHPLQCERTIAADIGCTGRRLMSSCHGLSGGSICSAERMRSASGVSNSTGAVIRGTTASR